MENKEISTKLLSTYIPELIVELGKWSEKGLSRLMDSGVLADIVDDSRLSDRPSLPPEELPYAVSDKNGTVTLSQFRRFIGYDLFSDEYKGGRFYSSFQVWSSHSAWWDDNTTNWELRDHWRFYNMGLPRINPIWHPLSLGYDIVFRQAGHSTPWTSPPEGYRYATLGEIRSIGNSLESFEELDIVFWLRQDEWVFMDGFLGAIYLYKFGQSADERFENSTFFIPLVKL